MTENIKAGWTRVAFGDVVQLCRERSSNPVEDGFDRYVGLDHLDPGDLKIRRWGNIDEGTTFTSVFHAGQVLFGKRRAYQHKLAVADFKGVCSGDIYVFEPKDEQLLPELLPFICQTDSFFGHAVGTSAGSLSPRTNWESLASYEFVLPPLEEQRRIVEAFSAVNAAIEGYKNLEDSAQNLYSSSRDIWVCKHKGPRVRLADICTLRGGNGFPYSHQNNASGEIPFVKVSDMNLPGNEKFIHMAANFISREQARDIDARIMPRGAVVFAKVGAALLQNRRRILAAETCIDNNMMAAIPRDEFVISEYLWLILLGIDFAQIVQPGAIPSVNQAGLGNIIIPLPSLEDQAVIIRRIEECGRVAQMCKSRIMRMKEFTGQLAKRQFDV
jgi:type I restriction enzyme S subunit